MKSIVTKSFLETHNLGKKMAKEFLMSSKQSRKHALVIGLKGDLGGGKTTFVQGFAKGLGIKEKILSPTFVILKKFHVPSFMFHDFYHIDCYRIKEPKELLDLGLKEIISDPKNIIIIEWADKVSQILPKEAIVLKFEFTGKSTRKIVLK